MRTAPRCGASPPRPRPSGPCGGGPWSCAPSTAMACRAPRRFAPRSGSWLIGRRFHKTVALSAIAQMLHRHRWSHQLPASRAAEGDEAKATGWVKEAWPQVESPVRCSTATSSSRTRLASR
ncbi:helix-turn-helix domain-containing protein [Streptomyces sp. NPDC055140]